MPKINPGGRKFRRSKKFGGFREKDLLEKGQGQKYGKLIKALGNRRFDCLCDDGVTRAARVPGSFTGRYYFHVDDWVLCSIRSFEQHKCDLLHRYHDEHVRLLSSKGDLDTINAIVSDNPPDDDYIEEDVEENVVIEPVNNQLLDEESDESDEEEESETAFEEKEATTKEKNYYESEEFLNL